MAISYNKLWKLLVDKKMSNLYLFFWGQKSYERIFKKKDMRKLL